jgi:uncharacterized protein
MAGSVIAAVDADGHFLERQSDIRRYLDGPWRDRRTDLWPGDQPWDSSLSDKLGHPFNYVSGLTPQQQVDLWLRVMDEHAIETAVLFPTGSGSVAKLQERDFAVAVARACNMHFAEDYARDRLKPVGVLPMRDPIAAAAELRRASRQLGLKGFEILTSGLPAALGDACYDPVYEAARECDVALCIHGTRSWGHEVGGATLRTFGEMHCYAFTASMLLQFTSIMLNGVTKRHPGLKLAFLEIGATWLPYYLDRLDEHWVKRSAVDSPMMDEKPSALFRKSNIIVSLEADETLIAETIAFAGAEHIVFASDIPHWDCEFPDNLRELRENATIPLAAKHQILRDNAKRFFAI